MRLLDARCLQVLQDHGDEIRCFAIAEPAVGQAAERLVVLVHRQRLMRRDALDGERSGDADASPVLVRFVVEIFGVGLHGDGGIDFLLASDAGRPPFGMRRFRFVRPAGAGFARDLPFLPCIIQGGIERLAQRLQRFLPRFPNGVDFRVVGDGLEGDMGDALVDEALAHVPAGRSFDERAVREFGFLAPAFRAVDEQIPRVASAHYPRSGEGQGDTGGVDGDPAPAPSLGDIGGGAGAAGRVKHEIAGVRGHQEAAFDNPLGRLDNERFMHLGTGVCPSLGYLRSDIIAVEISTAEGIPIRFYSKRFQKPRKTSQRMAPTTV